MSARAARRHDPEPEAPTPESFLEEIRAIINSGTLRGAREVAERGLALYPDHPELKHVHHELRPFEVKVNPDGWILDPLPNYKWLAKNKDAYLGKWVGLDQGELVLASDSFEAVLKAVRARHSRGTLIHHIIGF